MVAPQQNNQIPDFFKCCGDLTEIFTLSVLVRYALHTLQLESVRPGLENLKLL